MASVRAYSLCLALVLTGCVTAPPPLLTIGERDCATAPDLAAAHPVLLKSDSATKVTIDEKAACLRPAGERPRLYAVFALPTSTEPFFVSVTSEARGKGVLAPYLALLDAKGSVIREFGHDKFLVRGSSLNVAFRPQPAETYILVVSDPTVVGQESSGIVASTQATTVATGTGGFFMMTTGRESVRTLTKAHGGIIAVSAELLPQPH